MLKAGHDRERRACWSALIARNARPVVCEVPAAFGVLIWIAVTTIGACGNSPKPADSVTEVTLVERWRTGQDDDEVIFGSIVDVESARDRIFLLDAVMNDIKVLTMDGAYVATIAGEGDGPGGLRAPCDMTIMNDSLLVVCNSRSAKVDVFTLDGDFVRRADVAVDDGFVFLRGVRAWCDGIAVISVCNRADPHAVEVLYALDYYSAQFVFRGRLLERRVMCEPMVFDETKALFVERQSWCVSRKGELTVAPYATDVLWLKRWRCGGGEEPEVFRQYSPRRRDVEYLRWLHGRFDASGYMYDDVVLSPFSRVVDHVWPRECGGYLIRGSESKARERGAVALAFEMADAAGERTGFLHLVGNEIGADGGVYFVGEDNVLIVMELGVPGGTPTWAGDDLSFGAVCFSVAEGTLDGK